MAMPLVSIGAMQQYKAFASTLDTQAKPTSQNPRIYENLDAQVLIPLILLLSQVMKKLAACFCSMIGSVFMTMASSCMSVYVAIRLHCAML